VGSSGFEGDLKEKGLKPARCSISSIHRSFEGDLKEKGLKLVIQFAVCHFLGFEGDLKEKGLKPFSDGAFRDDPTF